MTILSTPTSVARRVPFSFGASAATTSPKPRIHATTRGVGELRHGARRDEDTPDRRRRGRQTRNSTRNSSTASLPALPVTTASTVVCAPMANAFAAGDDGR